MTASMQDRIAKRIEIDESGCWLWTGCLTDGGYGRIRVDGVELKVHRLSYELFIGPIPEGLDIDHLCRVRRCANPEHLEPVTRSVNLQRGVWPNSAKTHCPQGHPYTEANTYVWRRRRACRTCSAEHLRNHRARKASA